MSIIKSIIKKKISNEKLYNLAVKDDESYVANDIVVHNCRSLLIPITKYEEYDTDTKANNGQNLDKFIDENIGTGFSRFTKDVNNDHD